MCRRQTCSLMIAMSPIKPGNGDILTPSLYTPKGMFQGDGKAPNLSPGFIKDLSEKLGLNFTPEGQGDLESAFGPEDAFC